MKWFLPLLFLPFVVACGPSACEKAGGHLRFTHHIIIYQYNAATKTMTPIFIPQYECEIT